MKALLSDNATRLLSRIGNGKKRQISQATGVPLTTVHAILNRVHGWDKIAEGAVFKRHRQELNKALEQANRTLPKKSLEMAESKMDKASYSQLVFGAAIMTDKARLLAGESTSNVSIHNVVEVGVSLAELGKALAASLQERQEKADRLKQD